jgi:hypothetical protein
MSIGGSTGKSRAPSMTHDWPFPGLPVRPVALILDRLHASWPEPVTLRPTAIGLAAEQRHFLLALIALRDSGWVMFEALLVGSGTEPEALGAALTVKGLHEITENWPPA